MAPFVAFLGLVSVFLVRFSFTRFARRGPRTLEPQNPESFTRFARRGPQTLEPQNPESFTRFARREVSWFRTLLFAPTSSRRARVPHAQQILRATSITSRTTQTRPSTSIPFTCTITTRGRPTWACPSHFDSSRGRGGCQM